ncbi:hypothetical protein [Vulcanisaeta thermophila]|uniref:hypothetical protein n=1 Tax=Vulcanisaeta thermophila TaxID=867917 RepID=UPI000853EDF3|nr:hypothetical protein [Vulcanisaeta thermophila]
MTEYYIYQDIPPSSMASTVLITWVNHVEATSHVGGQLMNPLTLSPPRPLWYHFQVVQEPTVFLQGFTYVGTLGWYVSNVSGWFGNPVGTQYVKVNLYYAYQQSPGPYYWFLDYMEQGTEGSTSDGGYYPLGGTIIVNGYTYKWPGQSLWGGYSPGAYLTRVKSHIL